MGLFGDKSKSGKSAKITRVRVGNTVLGFSDEKPKGLSASEKKKQDIQRAKEQIKKSEQLGIKDYIIRTCEDSRVCDKCKKYENKKFPFKKAKIGVNFPPLHDDCRCYAESMVNPEYYKKGKDYK